MSPVVRCAVIGTGGVGGDNHIKGFLTHPQGRLVAIAELNDLRRQQVVERYGLVHGYKDYHELLANPDIDAVSIAVPNNLHVQVAIDAITAGKHVLLEKPMATTYADACRLIQVWEKSSVVFMVGQNYRFRRDVQLLAECIRLGELGMIYHVQTNYLRCTGSPKIGSWFTQEAFAGGGCTVDIGVHALDTALSLMGTFDVLSVTASQYATFGNRGLGESNYGNADFGVSKKFDVEDFASAFIRLRDGRSLVMHVSWAMHGQDDEQSLHVYGTEASATLYPVRLYRSVGNRREIILPERSHLQYPEERFVHFIDCIIGGKKPFVNPYDSLALQRVLDAIKKSSSTGMEVRFDDIVAGDQLAA